MPSDPTRSSKMTGGSENGKQGKFSDHKGKLFQNSEDGLPKNLKIFMIISISEEPGNNGCPKIICANSTPELQTSIAKLGSSNPKSNSGGRYHKGASCTLDAVLQSIPDANSSMQATLLPKSTRQTRSLARSSNTCAGEMPLWITSRE